MQIHKTKGIILRTVKYGETSIITTVYTELFGVQSYIVKGVRQTSKKTSSKANYFQPATVLQMEVYHHQQKQLQFIKEYQLAVNYQTLFYDVVRNAIAVFVVEVIQHTLKQPEANPDLYDLLESTLIAIDAGSATTVANIPLYFILQLATALGFQIQGNFSEQTRVLNLQEGFFEMQEPLHNNFLKDEMAAIVSVLQQTCSISDLEKIALNQQKRRELLQALQLYLSLHVQDFGTLKSFQILQEVLA
jgi:DNA repair protein RecO (recombination protein O)